jgi:uncharacterized phosphosugar-binding protein
MQGAAAYMNAVQALLDEIMQTQAAAIDKAASAVVDAIQRDGTVFVFGTGHSHMLAEEAHYRAGGLACVTPILIEMLMLHDNAVRGSEIERTRGLSAALLETYHPKAGDVLFIYSNSGVNAVPVEMALAGKTANMTVVAVIAADYAAMAKLGPVGKKLGEVADIVIDNRGIPGDAIVLIGDSGMHVGPTSTVSGAFIFNAIVTEVAWRLHEAGMPLPIFVSSNVPGAADHNRDLLARGRERNPHL